MVHLLSMFSFMSKNVVGMHKGPLMCPIAVIWKDYFLFQKTLFSGTFDLSKTPKSTKVFSGQVSPKFWVFGHLVGELGPNA